MEVHQKIGLLTAFVIVGGLILFQYIRVIRNYYRLQRRDRSVLNIYQERFEKAHKAKAICRAVKATGVSRVGNGMVKVVLGLEVFPGGLQHSTEITTWIVRWTDFAKLSSPEEIAVRIDAQDSRLIYPDIPWAHFDYTEDFLFTSDGV